MFEETDNNRPLNAYEQRLADKRERYEQHAETAKQKSEERYNAARKQVEFIPAGQPILIGHHSEQRHRRNLKRHNDHMRAAIEEERKAEYYEQKAQSVGTGGISSDDPDAINKLEKKLANCIEQQERMKTLNKVWRMYSKNPDAAKTQEALSKLSSNDKAIVVDYEPAYSWEKGPAQGYLLTNNNAEIRRLKKRIEELKKAGERKAPTPFSNEAFELIQNVELNRVQFKFAGKPTNEVRVILKQHSFRWSPSNGAWQRHLNHNGLYAAKRVKKILEELMVNSNLIENGLISDF